MAQTATEPEAPAEESQDNTAEADQSVEVRDAELPQTAAGNVKGAPGQIDILLDSTVSVSAGLGQTELQVRDLLRLGPGSVIKLDRSVGEPIDLYLRGIHFATGQLVVVGDNLAVKIKEILSPQEETA